MGYTDIKIIQSLFFLSLFFYSYEITNPNQSPQKKYVVIRSQHSTGLVLDAGEYNATLQNFTGFPAQLWRLESAGQGKYFIVNSANGNVLDIEDEASEGNNIITYEKHGGENQQWYVNSDKTIVSASGNLALDICEENFTAGNQIIAYPKHGRANQQWLLQNQQPVLFDDLTK